MKTCFSISKYISWLTLLPLLVMAVLITSIFLYDRTASMERNQLARGQLLARQLAVGCEYGIFENNREFLHELALQVLREPDVLSVRITDRAGVVLAAAGDIEHPFPQQRVGQHMMTVGGWCFFSQSMPHISLWTERRKIPPHHPRSGWSRSS